MIVKKITYTFDEPIQLEELDLLTIKMQRDMGLRPHGLEINGRKVDNTYLAEFETDEDEQVQEQPQQLRVQMLDCANIGWDGPQAYRQIVEKGEILALDAIQHYGQDLVLVRGQYFTHMPADCVKILDQGT